MIPTNITQEDILNGIRKVINEGYLSSRASTDYDVLYNNKKYPPKVVISYANTYRNGVEHPATAFSGGNESNYFIMGRGFPILLQRHKNPNDFFTSEELFFFSQYANKPYNSKDAIQKNAGAFIAKQIWRHSKMWADLIASKMPYVVKGKIAWNDRRNTATRQAFKGYSWYSLHHKTYDSNNVFYTVGVEGKGTTDLLGPQLVIKLDCRRKHLSKEKQAQFDNLLKEREVGWHIIPLADVIKHDWDSLFKWSEDYINSSVGIYKEAVDLLNGIQPAMYARIVWNTEDWVKPSGRDGKSKNDSHEKDYGYGHEEWLFDTDKQLDDYHYSRLEPLHTKKAKHVGKTFNIKLFTNNGIEKQWYWAGEIKNAEVIEGTLSVDVSNRYREKGWLAEQISQLKNHPDVNADNYNNWADNDRFNVRFRPEDLVYELIPFAEDETLPTLYYNLPEQGYTPTDPKRKKKRGKGIDTSTRSGRNTKKRFNRHTNDNLKEIYNIHGEIQDKLVEVLRETRKGRTIAPEAIKNFDNTRIDIVEQIGDNEYIFYEIKTYPSVQHSIRVALGQLLEYAYFPDEKLTKEFVIVSHIAANEDEIDYLKHISKMLGINVSYMHFDYKSGTIIE